MSFFIYRNISASYPSIGIWLYKTNFWNTTRCKSNLICTSATLMITLKFIYWETFTEYLTLLWVFEKHRHIKQGKYVPSVSFHSSESKLADRGNRISFSTRQCHPKWNLNQIFCRVLWFTTLQSMSVWTMNFFLIDSEFRIFSDLFLTII